MKCGPEPTTPDPLPPVVTPVTGPVLKLLPPGREHIRVEKRTIGQSGNVTTVAYAYVPALSQVTVEVTVVGQDPGKGQGRIVKLERAQQEKLDLLLGEIQGTVFKDKPEVACVAALLPGTVTRKLAAIYPREGEMNFVDDLCALTPTSRGQLEIKSFDASFQAIEALLK